MSEYLGTSRSTNRRLECHTFDYVQCDEDASFVLLGKNGDTPMCARHADKYMSVFGEHPEDWRIAMDGKCVVNIAEENRAR